MNIPNIVPLTSVRGLAAWWVVLYHFKDYLPMSFGATVQVVISRGSLAVDLFFVLSGFVITLNYSPLFIAPSWPALRRFALARVGRLYPLHLLMSLCFVLNVIGICFFSRSADLGTRYPLSGFLMSLALVQNWGFTSELTWNIPAWSISTEWAAYGVFPLMAFLIQRHLRRVWAIMLAIVMLLIALAGFFYLSGVHSIDQAIPRLGLIRCLSQFLLGMLLCRLYLATGAPGFGVQALLLAAGAAVTVAAIMAEVATFYWLPAVFALLVFALTAPAGPLTRLLSLTPLVFLGTISYATYLCHYFIKDWVKIIMIGPASENWQVFSIYLGAVFAASWVLYHLVELPGRALVRRWGGPENGRAALAWPQRGPA